ncbi:MAG: hypothetical protein ACRDQI_19395 [Pseudonocardiaceae bacterium]
MRGDSAARRSSGSVSHFQALEAHRGVDLRVEHLPQPGPQPSRRARGEYCGQLDERRVGEVPHLRRRQRVWLGEFGEHRAVGRQRTRVVRWQRHQRTARCRPVGQRHVPVPPLIVAAIPGQLDI